MERQHQVQAREVAPDVPDAALIVHPQQAKPRPGAQIVKGSEGALHGQGCSLPGDKQGRGPSGVETELRSGYTKPVDSVFTRMLPHGEILILLNRDVFVNDPEVSLIAVMSLRSEIAADRMTPAVATRSSVRWRDEPARGWVRAPKARSLAGSEGPGATGVSGRRD